MENNADEMNKKEEIVSENIQQENGEAANNSEVSEREENAELVKLQAELAAAKDKYLRLYSEFENFKRRTSREKLDMIQTANEQLLRSLLPVADDFERAEKSFREKNDKDAEGFFLIQSKFRKVLEQSGVKLMEVSQGSDFNPDLHEAITQIPAPNESLKGKVVDVIEKGYVLNEKVIRYAKVVVGN